MEVSKYEIYAYQILHYLVLTHHYQVIRVEQHQEDIWLANPKQEHYPVIRICSRRMGDMEETITYLRNVHRKILDLIHREGQLLVLNTSPDCFLLDTPMITQIRVAPEKVSDPQILATFQNLSDVLHDVEDPAEEIAQISRSIEEAQLKQQKKFMYAAKKWRKPSITMSVMGICMLYMIVTLGLELLIHNTSAAWIAAGAYYKMNIVAAHEYWRLLTAGFFHGDVVVMFFNMYVLYQAGKLCEPIFTRWQYIALLIGSIFCGNLCALIGEPNAIAYGIGAGICGISGAYLVSVLNNGTFRLPMVKFALLRILVLDLFIWLLPGNSFLAYAGGLIFGVLMGMSFLRNSHWPQLRKHARAAGSLLFGGLCLLGFGVKQVEPLNKTMDQQIIKVFENTMMDDYARYLKVCYNKQYRRE